MVVTVAKSPGRSSAAASPDAVNPPGQPPEAGALSDRDTTSIRVWLVSLTVRRCDVLPGPNSRIVMVRVPAATSTITPECLRSRPAATAATIGPAATRAARMHGEHVAEHRRLLIRILARTARNAPGSFWSKGAIFQTRCRLRRGQGFAFLTGRCCRRNTAVGLDSLRRAPGAGDGRGHAKPASAAGGSSSEVSIGDRHHRLTGMVEQAHSDPTVRSSSTLQSRR